MKTRKILLCLYFLSFSTLAFTQNYKFINEVRGGPVNLQIGSYKTLSENSLIGATAITGRAFPGIFVGITPEFRHYFQGHSKETTKYHGSFVAGVSLNILSIRPLMLPKPTLNLSASLSIGYEFKFKYNLFLRPTINLCIPIRPTNIKPLNFPETILINSMVSSYLSSVAIGYRF